MSAINALAEGLAKVLEPWSLVPQTDPNTGSKTVVADSETVVDLNMRRPVEHDGNTLYVWPTQHVHEPLGAGNGVDDKERFAIQFLYVIERVGEEPQSQARRDVSDALDDRAALYTARVAANRSRHADGTPAPWQHIEVTVQHDTVVTFGARGIGCLVTGYRIS